MCKSCYSDPAWDEIHYRRQGAVDVEDFYEEVNYAPRKKAKSVRKARDTRPGCPGNEYKAHVYVWTTEGQEANFFSDYFGFHKNQYNVCVGCNKTKGMKLSDEYMKVKERKWAKLSTPEKGVPVSRWLYRTKGRPSYLYNF